MISRDSLVLLDVDTSSGVATITLNNPSSLNPLTAAMGVAFSEAVDAVCNRVDEVGCVVLTGAGRAFSAGGVRTLLPPAPSPFPLVGHSPLVVCTHGLCSFISSGLPLFWIRTLEPVWPTCTALRYVRHNVCGLGWWCLIAA